MTIYIPTSVIPFNVPRAPPTPALLGGAGVQRPPLSPAGKVTTPGPLPPRDLHLAARGRRIQLLDETKRSRSVFLVSGYDGN